MLVEHRGCSPVVDPSAYVAPTAVLCGDVRVGPDARVLFGAVLSAEDGSVEIGARCVVMENALLRGRGDNPVRLGDDVLVGPHAHINGSMIGSGCFLATGSSLFPGSRLGRDVEVRINGIVQVNSVLEDPGGTRLPRDRLRAPTWRLGARANGAPGRLVRRARRRPGRVLADQAASLSTATGRVCGSSSPRRPASQRAGS